MIRRYLLIFLIIIVAGAAYFTDFFVKKNREETENISLKQENQELLAQIQRSHLFVDGEGGSLGSFWVFSTYPFNIKNTVTISGGEKEGIKKNMVATLEQDILVGRVSDVLDGYSIIQTVFDPSWQMSVRIGEAEVDGLLEGGNKPRVTLIEKNKPCVEGDIVYSASKDFPYGLKIGEVVSVKETPGGVFKEAVLKIPFNISEVRKINIILH